MRGVTTLLLLGSSLSFAQPVSFVGDVVVVQDPAGAITDLVTGMTTIIPSPQEQFCRAAYNAMRTVLPDQYDGVFAFSTADNTWSDINNVWQGNPVRADGTGYGRSNSPWANTYNGSKIGQCVFMGTLGNTAGFLPGTAGAEALPSDPDANWKPSVGFAIPGLESLTGIEMLGHEYGHHWLLGVEFDQSDGRGKQHFIRGYDDSGAPNTTGSPNQHYSAYADSRSVMYGDCLTDLGGGNFRFAGCERKYSHIDQYLMGLRAPADVSPMMVLEETADPGKGSPAIAMSRSSSRNASGFSRSDITAQEIIDAVGSRVPAYPNAPSCFRVAFVVVLAPGQTSMPTAMAQKVEKYRARWAPWFSFATDGRGSMDTRINGGGCQVLLPADGGTTTADAGTTTVDAGTEDAGTVTADDAGTSATDDAGTPGEVLQPPDGPSKEDTRIDLGTTKLKPGCGCGASGFEPFALLAVLAARRLRRRR